MDSQKTTATRPLGEQLADFGGGAHALATQILGNREEAADAVQDAIVRALQQPESYDARRGALRPWFFGVVRNRCLDLLRRRRDTGGDVDTLAAEQRSPEEHAVASDGANRLRRALAALAPHQREILILRDFNDLDYAEIATVLNLPKGTVMSRLHRARLALRKEMIRRDPD